MSLMGTLAKVAVGVAIAKGVSSMAARPASQPQQGRTSDDGLFRAPNSPGARAEEPKADMHGLENMMDSILGGAAQAPERQARAEPVPDRAPERAPDRTRPAQGGLGELLEQLAGGGAPASTKPPKGQTHTQPPRDGGPSLEDMLGGLAGKAGAGGDLGGLLGGLMGALQGGQQQSEGGFGEVLNSQFNTTPQKAKKPSPDQEVAAGIMLSAMIQAAKSDGRFDESERAKLLDKLGDISPAERTFVQAEMAKPVDAKVLARNVPRGLERQVYAMSVLGIDLDTQDEAQYLHQLATEMSVSRDQVNAIHDRMGLPRLYR